MICPSCRRIPHGSSANFRTGKLKNNRQILRFFDYNAGEISLRLYTHPQNLIITYPASQKSPQKSTCVTKDSVLSINSPFSSINPEVLMKSWKRVRTASLQSLAASTVLPPRCLRAEAELA
jgi:hypothetical protein